MTIPLIRMLLCSTKTISFFLNNKIYLSENILRAASSNKTALLSYGLLIKYQNMCV